MRLHVRLEQPDDSLRVDFGEVNTASVPMTTDYDDLDNRPSINGHLLVGGENDLSDLGISNLPSGGNIGDIMMKRSQDDFDAEWVAPANRAEQDNTRPITAAAVYTEIGNINALLATI